MTSLKTSIKTITYLSDIGCLEIQGASLLSLLVVSVSKLNQGLTFKLPFTGEAVKFLLVKIAA